MCTYHRANRDSAASARPARAGGAKARARSPQRSCRRHRVRLATPVLLPTPAHFYSTYTTYNTTTTLSRRKTASSKPPLVTSLVPNPRSNLFFRCGQFKEIGGLPRFKNVASRSGFAVPPFFISICLCFELLGISGDPMFYSSGFLSGTNSRFQYPTGLDFLG